jgi:hypothetical protein
VPVVGNSPEDAAKQFSFLASIPSVRQSHNQQVDPRTPGTAPKTPRSPWEIEAWSAFMDKRAPDSDAETLAFFAEHMGRLSKTREDVKTLFEFGELDDYVSFGGKA